jgi:hypothetical protein
MVDGVDELGLWRSVGRRNRSPYFNGDLRM